MYFSLSLIAFVIDKIFGEFNFIKHPVILMGDFIKFFENKFYKNSLFRGVLLNFSLLFVVWFVVFVIEIFIDNVYILGFIASTGIASNMLYKSVKDILIHPQNIRFLVSRDTKELNSSDINKAAIETYSENLSDGVIAPFFYLVCFGLHGLFLYKAINTLDSMVGYKNKKYEKFGKFSAKLDDIANFIPSRITAVIIALLFFSKSAFLNFYKFGKKHESLNAGHPISAMAICIGVKLGGPTSYFGVKKNKPYFGYGKDVINKEDLKKALSMHVKMEIFIILILLIGVFL
ncbi:adenosylcobinamide-phosphate synthase CbiB [Sulfurospirillum arcachonense]|uniref:adenosylcobinamide-phosphate synthase CbiB n=1 Tax=Sulfurospirillum arcachonense TaxID=57666 RepID=UPI000468A14C|nr:adenosylcobinamide-phosphate synthase CbiB [Sulfurospirillum arcachonense]